MNASGVVSPRDNKTRVRTLVWFRGKDLRVSDHLALREAAEQGDVVPLFVLDPYFFAPERARELPNRMQFLLASLRELQATIATLGSTLIVVEGRAIDRVPEIAKLVNADRVFGYRWSEPIGRKRDAIVAKRLEVPFLLYEGETLASPTTIRTGGGTPYTVFTPFARAFRKTITVAPPKPGPKKLDPVPSDARAALKEMAVAIPTMADLGMEENERITPGGEAASKKRLAYFIAKIGAHYEDERNRMDHAGTSRLSQDLKFGTLSAATVWHAVIRGLDEHPRALSVFTNELLWREFTHATLWDRPNVLEKPFRKDFVDFPWRDEQESHEDWQAWTEGRTGYPVVDAAARQLLAEGFVHNRARMIAASFLCKHLLIDYARGEAHYMKFLTDGDWAQNNSGWQWSAGTGCDAQPYFRIFNPVTQGTRFDPEGTYVRTWVPELAQVPTKYIHAPWNAPREILRAHGVELGKTYPKPVVIHEFGRDRFLRTADAHKGKPGPAKTERKDESP